MSDGTDDSGSSFSWTAPSYGLGGNFQTTPGLSTGNLGDYSLGTNLGSVGQGGTTGPSFGGTQLSSSQQQNFLENLYKSPTFGDTGFSLANQKYGTLESPLLGENEKVNWQNLGVMQKDLAKLPQITFGNPVENKQQDITSLAEQAQKNGTTLASVLGREPTRDELSALSKGGYGSMYGVNPNNLEGQNVDHMIASAKTSDFLGKAGNFLLSAVMPAPVSLALNGAKAYNEYQKTGDWKQALATVMGGTGGYTGAVGQALQGNYGNAVTSALSKGGAAPLTSLLAGTGVDAAQGKDVSKNLGGLAGYSLGTSVSPSYGGFGQALGRSFLSDLFKKK